MTDSQMLLNRMVSGGVKKNRDKPRFGRRRAVERDPLPEGSLVARALDGKEGPASPDDGDKTRLLMRAMIAAANADGTLDAEERERIGQRFGDVDSADAAMLRAELDTPLDIPSLVADVDSPATAVDVYAVSLMAIELDTPDEHRYLHQLAKQLNLDEKTVAGLHDRTGAPPLMPAEGDSPGAGGAAAAWYFCVGDQRSGPMPTDFAARYARATPDALCWREGFDDWLPVAEVAELAEILAPAVAHSRAAGRDDDIDYKIVGNEMQFVEVELDPGESVIAEAGTMMYKDAGINMTTIFGDGKGQDQGFMGKLVGAGKRVLTGESLFLTVFTHEAAGKAHVAFAAPYPGNIVPIKLSDFGGSFICQKDAFLAAAKGVSIGIHFQQNFLAGLFGGEGFIMQSLEGDGWAFIHAGGTLVERTLGAGEEFHVDTGCVCALEPTVQFSVTRVGNVKSMIFGGEGMFFANLVGPGRIWLQSLPFSRLAGRMLAAAPGGGGGSVGEGSSLAGAVGGALLKGVLRGN